MIQYFDARMIGMTATLPSFIARDTFRVFDCPEAIVAVENPEAAARIAD